MKTLPNSRMTNDDSDPPCSRCDFARECTVPDACRAFAVYVATGKQIEPPRELP